MLVPAMNEKEMSAEIWKDLAALHKSTLQRVRNEYDRERRKLKIANERTYPRCYPVRTKAKNNWLVFMEKAPAVAKYKTEEDAVFCTVVHFQGSKGWKVFKPLLQSGLLIVYNDHLFIRYNERLQLHLTRPLEIIQRFFTHSGYSEHQVIEKADRLFSMGICRDGILLGEYKPAIKWLVNKTFICRDLYRAGQGETEKKLIIELQTEIAEALANEPACAATHYKANTLEAIKGSRHL